MKLIIVIGTHTIPPEVALVWCDPIELIAIYLERYGR